MKDNKMLLWVLNTVAGIVLFFIIGFVIKAFSILVDYFFSVGSFAVHTHPHTHSLDVLSFYVSTIIILFPLLYFLLKKVKHLLEKDTFLDRFSYFIILVVIAVSFVLIFAPGIIFLSSLLRGDVILPVFLKLLFTAGVGASMFYYYTGLIRKLHPYLEVFKGTVVLSLILLIATFVFLVNPFTSVAGLSELLQ